MGFTAFKPGAQRQTKTGTKRSTPDENEKAKGRLNKKKAATKTHNQRKAKMKTMNKTKPNR